ncbi:MAG: DNA repair protein RecO [Armatimonadaceae bacterium]
MAVYKANAIVLRRIPLGETDKILTLFTREGGKFNVVAKGARKTTSKLSGATEPLIVLRGLLAEGMNLDVLTQCEITDSFPGLRGDFGLFLRATYACELLDRLTEERDTSPEAFDLLVATLHLLETARDPDAPLHAYELKLMTQAGYEPLLDMCARCEEPLPEPSDVAAYSPVRGGVLCAGCAQQTAEEPLPLSPESARWMYFLAYESKPHKVAEACLPPAVEEELRRALRAHLRYRLERDVRSTAFLDALHVGAMA